MLIYFEREGSPGFVRVNGEQVFRPVTVDGRPER
jgi:hypothetical protein